MKNHDHELTRIFHSAQDVAGRLWEKGWAEKNAGNFSINISPLRARPLKLTVPVKLEPRFPALAGHTLLVTATGSRMRDLARDPMSGLVIIQVGDHGATYQTASTGRNQPPFKPTSELASHLAIQESFLRRRSNKKVVLHTHPDELVAMTHLLVGQNARELNHVLLAMHPEVGYTLSRGAGLVPFLTPGSPALARASVRALEHHDLVLWERHGCLAAGVDIIEAFDLVDVLNKAAKIFFLVRRVGLTGGRI